MLFLKILLKILQRNWRILSFTLVSLSLAMVILFKLNLSSTATNQLSEGIIGTYQEHDLPEVVTRLISQSLVEADENGRMKAKLAQGWQINNDATIFTFKLKEGLTWSDKTVIRPQDLEFAIPDVEVNFPQENLIQFTLKDAFTPLPSLLTKPLLKKDTLLGTGPYKIEKIEKSRIFITKIVMSSNNPSLPKLIIRFYPNEKTAITALSLGEIQSIWGINDISSFKDQPLMKLYQKISYTRIVTILYNTKGPLLSNRSLRQALSFSAPKIAGEEVVKSPIPPMSWAFSQESKNYLDNMAEAKAALIRAKASSSEEILKKGLVLTTTPQLEEVGKKIVSSWQELGLNALLRVESGIPQNFQALLIAQSIPIDPDQYSLWHSTQTKTNLTKYSSARVDKDLEDGRKSLQEEDRKLKYQDFQKMLLEDSPATFLYFPKYNIIYLQKAEKNLLKVLSLQIP